MRIGALCKDGIYSNAELALITMESSSEFYADTKPQNTYNFASSTYRQEQKKNNYKAESKRTTNRPESKIPTQIPESTRTYYRPEQTKTKYKPESQKPTYRPESRNSTYQPKQKKSTYQPEFQKQTYRPEYKKLNYLDEYKFMEFQKETAIEKQQKATIQNLKSRINNYQAQKEKINQDLIDNKNKYVNQLASKIKEKEKQVALIQKEKNRVQSQNKWHKQSMYKNLVERQKEKNTYEGTINELQKKCKALQNDILLSKKKQISNVQIQKKIVQRCKQIRQKLQKDHKKQTDSLIQKVEKLKYDMNQKQTKFNLQQERNKKNIDSLKQQLKKQRNSHQLLKEKYLKQQKYKSYQKQLQIKQFLQKDNLQKANQQLTKQLQNLKLNHSKDIIKSKQQNQKLNEKLIYEKEIRIQQVDRVKTLLTGKYEKQIKILQENHKLKQKLWIIQSQSPQKMMIYAQHEKIYMKIQNQQRQRKQINQKQIKYNRSNVSNQDPQYEQSNSIKRFDENQLPISQNQSQDNQLQDNQNVQASILKDNKNQYLLSSQKFSSSKSGKSFIYLPFNINKLRQILKQTENSNII